LVRQISKRSPIWKTCSSPGFDALNAASPEEAGQLDGEPKAGIGEALGGFGQQMQVGNEDAPVPGSQAAIRESSHQAQAGPGSWEARGEELLDVVVVDHGPIAPLGRVSERANPDLHGTPPGVPTTSAISSVRIAAHAPLQSAEASSALHP
jgi:hypothetical protein